MPTAVRERTLRASPDAVWRVIEDPHHMPRWWPGVERMESVDSDQFTQVFTTKRGRRVRADFRVVASEAPWRRSWEQQIQGTPFERVLAESVIEMALEPVPEGTHVTVIHRQRLRGFSRTGGFLLRRATGEKLAAALDGLERVVS